jgi:hypothetical protein
VNEKIERLESSVESAQAVLDNAHRVLSAIDQAQQHVEHAVTTLRRTAILVGVGGAVVAGLMLLRRRSL